MKRKGLLHLLCATMLLAIAIVYLPSCSNDEEGSEYWTVTLEDHYAPYQYDLEDMLQQVGTCNPPPYTFELVEVISKKQPKIGPAI